MGGGEGGEGDWRSFEVELLELELLREGEGRLWARMKVRRLGRQTARREETISTRAQTSAEGGDWNVSFFLMYIGD